MFRVTVDSTNLSRAIAGLREALISSGQSGDAAMIVKDEARRLANDITKATGPKSKAKQNQAIKADVGKSFSILTDNIRKKNQGTTSLKWSVAGPKFLYGIYPGKDLRGRDDEAYLLMLHRKAQQNPAKKLVFLKRRGKQRIYKVMSYVIGKQASRKLIKTLIARTGRKKASWATSAIALGEKAVPSWIAQHTPSPKAITNISGLSNADSPSVLFGSRAPGVNRDKDMVRTLMNGRIQKIVARTKLIVNGYNKDIEQGDLPHKRGKESASVSS